jgi:hypothetical protein
VGHVTYLAVDWGRSVNINQVEDRGQKGRHTSKGVELPRSQFSPKRQDGRGERMETPAVTNPYRPAIGPLPSDDIELIIKGREELPAGCGGSS